MQKEGPLAREEAGVITEELQHPISEFQLLLEESSKALDLRFVGQRLRVLCRAEIGGWTSQRM